MCVSGAARDLTLIVCPGVSGWPQPVALFAKGVGVAKAWAAGSESATVALAPLTCREL